MTGERRINSTLRVYIYGLRYLSVSSISCYYSIKICRSVYRVQKFMNTCVFNTTVYEYLSSRTVTQHGYHRDIHITSRAFGTSYATIYTFSKELYYYYYYYYYIPEIRYYQEGNKLMFLSEWCEFPSATCLAGKKKTSWQFASRFCWNRARSWHASEPVSFLVRLRTYQHPGITRDYNPREMCYCKTLRSELLLENVSNVVRLTLLEITMFSAQNYCWTSCTVHKY